MWSLPAGALVNGTRAVDLAQDVADALDGTLIEHANAASQALRLDSPSADGIFNPVDGLTQFSGNRPDGRRRL
jgi:hypothetical protein